MMIDHLTKLIHLDGEDAAVFALVTFFLDRSCEAFVDGDDAMAQEILKADDHRSLQAHAEGFVDDIEHANAPLIGAGMDVDEPPFVDGDVTGAPSFETVQFF